MSDNHRKIENGKKSKKSVIIILRGKNNFESEHIMSIVLEKMKKQKIQKKCHNMNRRKNL